MDPKNLGLGPRVAAFLKTAYPQHRAKLIARDFRVSTGTAERWLSGHAPTAAHIEEMYAKWGERFARAIFPEAFIQNDERLAMLERPMGRSAAAAATASGSWFLSTLPVIGALASWLHPEKRERRRLLQGLAATVPKARDKDE